MHPLQDPHTLSFKSSQFHLLNTSGSGPYSQLDIPTIPALAQALLGSLQTRFLKFQCAHESPAYFVKIQVLRMGPKNSHFHQILGDTDAAGPGSTL